MSGRGTKIRSLSVWRSLVIGTLVLTGGTIIAVHRQPLTASPLASTPLIRVAIISIDSLGPEEITPDLTPFLSELKKETGIWFDSVAVPPAVTIPNHAALLTGVRGNRNGFVSNFARKEEEPLRFFHADHLFTRLARERSEVNTALFTDWAPIFLQFEDEREEQTPPNPNLLTEDPFGAFLAWTRATPAPQFALVHDVKVDEMGHFATPELEKARTARRVEILKVDQRLKLLVDALQAPPEVWSETILFIVSDHNMDYAPLTNFVDPDPVRNHPDAKCSEGEDSRLLDAGGHQFVDVLPCKEEIIAKEKFDARVDRIVGLLQDPTKYERPPLDPNVDPNVKAAAGVGLVVSDRTTPSRADLGVDFLHGDWKKDPRDILMFVKKGYTFFPTSSGMHGHPITQANVLMVTGGHEGLADTTSRRPQWKFEKPTEMRFASPFDRPSILSVAPTVARLLGLKNDHFYEGKHLNEAFDPGFLE